MPVSVTLVREGCCFVLFPSVLASLFSFQLLMPCISFYWQCTLGNIDTETNKKKTAGDLKHIEHAPADKTAQAIVQAGQTRQREIYHPLEQGLETTSMDTGSDRSAPVECRDLGPLVRLKLPRLVGCFQIETCSMPVSKRPCLDRISHITSIYMSYMPGDVIGDVVYVSMAEVFSYSGGACLLCVVVVRCLLLEA